VNGHAENEEFARLIDARPFRQRTPQRPTQLRPDSALIVRRPRVVHARIENGQCSGHHRCSKLRVADPLKCGVTPLEHRT
jgi:hypothetical protein